MDMAHASLAQLCVTYIPVNELKPYGRNSRKHSKAQIRQIADSISAFGFTNPALVDKDNTIIAGHGRVEAAKLIGMETVPTIRLEHMTDGQKKAYIIADNRLAENSKWDKEILATELELLTQTTLEFDLEVTGFERPAIDFMVQDLDRREPEDGDQIPDLPKTPVTQPGDLWALGEHKVYCGDSLDPASYRILMGEEKAAMVFTDPPYNVPIAGHVSGLGKVKHEDFAMACGEMSEAEFTAFLRKAFTHMTAFSKDGSVHFVCMDWRHMLELLVAGKQAYTELKNICVWAKDNGGMGSLYRSRHEMVAVFKHGKDPHINNIELGKHGRYRTNVWNYRGVSAMRKGRNKDLAMHPTVKPVAMVADAILDCSHRGDIILDPFGGSGSTLIAAEKTGRTARLIELDPRYVDVIIRRWEEFAGLKAIKIPKEAQ